MSKLTIFIISIWMIAAHASSHNVHFSSGDPLKLDTINFRDLNHTYTLVTYSNDEGLFQLSVDKHDSVKPLDYILWDSDGAGGLDALIHYDYESSKYVSKSLDSPIDLSAIVDFQVQIEDIWFPGYYDASGAIPIGLSTFAESKYLPIQGATQFIWPEEDIDNAIAALEPYGSIIIQDDMQTLLYDSNGDGIWDVEAIDEDGDGEWDTETYALTDEELTEWHGIELIETSLVNVQGGTFTMGCTSGFQNGCEYQDPVTRTVTVDDFAILDKEITQSMWITVMGTVIEEDNYAKEFVSQFSEDKWNHPVEYVHYEMALHFIDELNNISGDTYRLPTEAEWEYAARSGETYEEYAGSSILNKVSWSYRNSNYIAHEVAQLEPNAFGIYDMSGNVAEWCSDWYAPYASSSDTIYNPKGAEIGTYRILRGGAYNLRDKGLFRVYARNYAMPDHLSDGVGFRIVLDNY